MAATFSVFGVTLKRATELAEKAVAKDVEKMEEQPSQTEYRAMVRKRAVDVLATMEPFLLSHEFASAENAKNYFAVAKQQDGVERLSVYKKVPKVDDKGQPIVDKRTKDRRPKMKWVPLDTPEHYEFDDLFSQDLLMPVSIPTVNKEVPAAQAA